jgi:hypothetical protein
MKLFEMFPAADAPDENVEIDWIDDLKFYIDNDNRELSNHLFPAIKKHQENGKSEDAYRYYLKPILSCCKDYCNKFDIKDPKEKFTKEGLVELAKRIATEQEKHIEDGDYEDK